MIVLLLVHIICVVIWVGGMAFAHFMLRPAASSLEPATRLPLWRRVFERFFPAVWILIVLLLLSGYGMVSVGFGGFSHLPLYVNIMQGLGIVMIALFAHLYFAPWQRFRRGLDSGDLAGAARQLGQIRTTVTFNLALGLVVVGVGATGRYWST